VAARNNQVIMQLDAERLCQVRQASGDLDIASARP
jgi:hypothetical protein